MTIDIYLVRHAQSCSNAERENMKDASTYRIKSNDVLYEPSLSINGYIQSFFLRDYLSKSKSLTYDKVICSPLIRTVITGMIALSTLNDEENRNVIYIVPYVKFHNKKLSKINRVVELKEKIHNFTLWFHNTGIHLYKLYQDIHPTSPKNITSIHFPKIDYTELEKYERRFQENEKINIPKEFQEYISQLNVSSVLLFTHKQFISRIARISHEPTNTSITKMILDVPVFENDTRTNKMNSRQVYQPPAKIRTLKINRRSAIDTCKNTKSFLRNATTRKLRRRVKV